MSSSSSASNNGIKNNEQQENIPMSKSLLYESDPGKHKPWYPNPAELQITNEKRPGHLTKAEKKRLRDGMLPIYPNQDDFKDYKPGGRFYSSHEEVQERIKEMLKAEKAQAEKEHKEKLWRKANYEWEAARGRGGFTMAPRGGGEWQRNNACTVVNEYGHGQEATFNTNNEQSTSAEHNKGEQPSVRDSYAANYGRRGRGRADLYKNLNKL